MIKDVTIGQFYPLDSPVHRLDPRTKIKGMLMYVIMLFVVNNIAGFAIAAFFISAVVLASRIPPGYVLRGIKPVAYVLVFTVVLNMLWTPGEIVASFWIFKISDAGLRASFKMGLRLILLVCGTSMMTLATSPIALTDGIEALIGKVPLMRRVSHEIAMMTSIALRFIPTLMEETDRIMKAQKSRGADFESGNIVRRARALIPVLVPLFVSAFQRADDLAVAMESRCYTGGKNRTRMNELSYSRSDRAASAALWLLVAAMAASRLLGADWLL